MLVTPSVHESMNSDLLQQLSCHLHSSCIPLLWPLLCVTLKILQNNHRTLAATHVFASGGIVGLPLALALAPFVFEELFIYSAVLIAPEAECLGWFDDGCDCSWLVSQLCLFCQSLMLSFLRSKTHGSCSCFLCSDPRCRYR